MLKQRTLILLFIPTLLLFSCGKPSWVLSEKQMEDVLFDIHIAEAEINDNYMDFRTNEQKQELYAGVFKKHGVIREQFDTSFVWYGKNLAKYLAIYDNLDKRYAILADSITARIDRQKIQIVTPDSNRIYIWETPSAFMLTSSAEKNMFSFNMDTVKLSAKADYEFRFSVLGITDSITPSVTLGIAFSDSVLVKREKITDNGLFTISISAADSIKNNPSRIFGSIRIAPQKGNSSITIYDAGLYKKETNLCSDHLYHSEYIK